MGILRRELAGFAGFPSPLRVATSGTIRSAVEAALKMVGRQHVWLSDVQHYPYRKYETM